MQTVQCAHWTRGILHIVSTTVHSAVQLISERWDVYSRQRGAGREGSQAGQVNNQCFQFHQMFFVGSINVRSWVRWAAAVLCTLHITAHYFCTLLITAHCLCTLIITAHCALFTAALHTVHITHYTALHRTELCTVQWSSQQCVHSLCWVWLFVLHRWAHSVKFVVSSALCSTFSKKVHTL